MGNKKHDYSFIQEVTKQDVTKAAAKIDKMPKDDKHEIRTCYVLYNQRKYAPKQLFILALEERGWETDLSGFTTYQALRQFRKLGFKTYDRKGVHVHEKGATIQKDFFPKAFDKLPQKRQAALMKQMINYVLTQVPNAEFILKNAQKAVLQP